MSTGSQSLIKNIFIVLACCVLVFLCTYKLTETPPTWMDEGIITQVGVNVAEVGFYGYQMAPTELIGAEFMTTSYPIMLPLALAFKIFGTDLFVARIVAIFFILFLVAGAYALIREEVADNNSYIPLLSLFLLVSFAPLYGHGKNVLGEVPGMAFLIAMLFFLSRIKSITSTSMKSDWSIVLLTGICGGLAMATKPIFLILIVPSVFFVIFLTHRKTLTYKQKLLLVFGSIVPLSFWYVIQFAGNSPHEAFIAGNPDSLSLIPLVLSNAYRFISEMQPMYAGLLVLVWAISMIVRKVKKGPVTAVEFIAFVLCILDLLSFLTTRGFYRYFFPSQVLSLIFLPVAISSLLSMVSLYTRRRVITIAVCSVLICFQFYQTFFHSWISEFATSTRSAELASELSKIPESKSIFFYNVPEAVIFLPHRNYYQYMAFSETIQRGKNKIELLEQGVPEYILGDDRFVPTESMRERYEVDRSFNKYTLYRKNKF